MDNNLLNNILENTFTIDLLKHRLRILKAYMSDKIYVFRSEQSSNLSQDDLVWLESLGHSLFQGLDKDNLSEFFEKLDKEIEKIPILTMYLTFDPGHNEIRDLGSWVRKNFLNAIIIEAKFDPELIGGCALVWKGIYKDYSVRQLIDQNRDRILADFRTYFKTQ